MTIILPFVLNSRASFISLLLRVLNEVVHLCVTH